MKILSLVLSITVMAVLLAPEAFSQEPAREALPNAVFAFASDSGAELLADLSEESSEKIAVIKTFNKAICPDGKILDITFVKHQPRSEKGNGRQTSRNFKNLAGDVFHVVHGKLKADDNCLLVSRNYLQSKRLVPMKTGGLTPEGFPARPAKCDGKTKSGLPHQQNRAPAGCWQLAQISDDDRLLAVTYEPRKKNLLAGLVLQIGERYMIHEMPATANSVSAWREGDGGEFDPAVFAPLFALQNEKDGSWEIGIVWSGEEGGNLSVYRSKGSTLEEVVKGYRYWMAE